MFKYACVVSADEEYDEWVQESSSLSLISSTVDSFLCESLIRLFLHIYALWNLVLVSSNAGLSVSLLSCYYPGHTKAGPFSDLRIHRGLYHSGRHREGLQASEEESGLPGVCTVPFHIK
jgi:hypothetical protein